MFPYILLYSIKQLKGERSVSAIFHTLIGKKSSQTFQDVHAYGLTSFFGIARSLTKEELLNEINRLSQKGYIYQNKDYLLLTQEGVNFLNNRNALSPITWLNGTQYHQMDQVFWARFLLFVQTGSNIAAQQHQFIPVDDRRDILDWVKQKYHLEKTDLKHYLSMIYDEVKNLYNQFPDWLAEFITLRMTSYYRYGLSKEQLAYRYQISRIDVELYITSVSHYMLSVILEKPNDFPVLYNFCQDLIKELPLTESARKTWDLLQKNLTISNISGIRRLKQSTIQDHIVEIALVDPSFNIHSFIPNETVENISHMAKQLNTNRLKVIKDNLHNQYSYFEIRLVLAALKKEEV